MTYEEACAQHSWDVPERYNIAADVCDKHPRDKLAMIHEDPDGNVRELDWGELQDMSNRFALPAARARRASAATASRCCCRRRPRPPPRSSATWKSGAILLSMSVLYGDEGIAHRLNDSQAAVVVTNAANRARVEGLAKVIEIEPGDLSDGSTDFEPVDTAADDPAQLYYTSGTTGLAKGILHAHRYILGHNEFVYCHDVQDGERFHGMGEWAWAAGHLAADRAVALRRRADRAAAQGRLRPARPARVPLAPPPDERLRHADGDPLDDGHLRRRARATRRTSASSARRASR